MNLVSYLILEMGYLLVYFLGYFIQAFVELRNPKFLWTNSIIMNENIIKILDTYLAYYCVHNNI
jgi:hypothetical protein